MIRKRKNIATLGQLLAACLLLQAASVAQEPASPHFWDEIPACPSTTPPTAITDDYWHGQFERVNREIAAADRTELVFFGDSITWHWSLGSADGRKVWEENYGKHRPINMGNSGDITPVMLHRVTHGNLAFPVGKEPKIAVLLCGTNNFTVTQSDGGKVRWELGVNCPPEDVAAGMRAVAQAFRRALPRTRVVMMGILPVKEPHKRAFCEAANTIQAALACHRDEVVFLDAGKDFLQADGSLNPKLFSDGTHLTEEGYRTWARAIDPVLKEMLKAPPLDPIEIMLIGDAMTEGANPESSYRRHLDGMLRREGHLIDFIGRSKTHHERNSEGQRFAYDPDHEGHWGRDSKWLAENSSAMLAGKAPAIAVVQIDGNDTASATLISNLEKIVAALRTANAEVKIVITLTIPLPEKADAVRNLNQAITAYSEAHSTQRSPLVIADLSDGFDASQHLAADNRQTNPSGAKRIAERIAKTLDPLLDKKPR